jgi:hypothetical protein
MRLKFLSIITPNLSRQTLKEAQAWLIASSWFGIAERETLCEVQRTPYAG